MKRIPVLLAAALAVTPLAAVFAAPEPADVDRDALRRAVPASAMLESDVLTQDDREFGELEDILMTRNGELELFLVDIEDSDLDDDEERDPVPPEPAQEIGELGTEVDVDGDVTANGDELDHVVVNRGAVEWGEDLVPISPRDMRYDTAGDDLIVRDGASPRRTPESRREDMLSLDELIGMEVNLADEESFGSVEDVMLDSRQSKAVALVVDNWDGLDKQRRALPVDAAIIRYDEEEVVYPYTVEQIESVPEFDLDEYSDDGWELD